MIRAWLVAHNAIPVGLAFAVITVGGSSYALMGVPGAHGGPLPLWLLTPPALAVLASAAVSNDIPVFGWQVRQVMVGRVVWELVVTGLAALAAKVVGHAAGQSHLSLLTVLLVGFVFTASTAIGRGCVLVGAVPMLAMLGSPDSVRNHTPRTVWELLHPAVQVGAIMACVGGLVLYVLLGACER